MAKVLKRPGLYEDDYLAWCEQQAAILRAGRLDDLDLANIAEELETMGRSERGELENRLEVLLTHLLKCHHQPARRSRSWEATINEQRTRLRRLLRRSPSLKRDLAGTVAEVFPDAVRQAAIETGLDPSVFPEAVPWPVDQILEPDPLAQA
jgi:Domain of unknown function DUF29